MNNMQHPTTATTKRRRRRGQSSGIMATDDTDASWSDDGGVSILHTSPSFPREHSTFIIHSSTVHGRTDYEDDDASSSSVATAELVRRIRQSQVVVVVAVAESHAVVVPPAGAPTQSTDPRRSVYENTRESPLSSPHFLDPEQDDADSVDTAELVRRIRQPLKDDLPPPGVVDIPVTTTTTTTLTNWDHLRKGIPPPNVVVETNHVPGSGLDPRAPMNDEDDEFVLPEECDDDDDDVDLPEQLCHDESEGPKQYDDEFVLPDQSEDEFVLPDQSDDESVFPAEKVPDEFVLPDPSDGSDNDDGDDNDDGAVSDKRNGYAVTTGPQCRADHKNRKSERRGGMVPTLMTTYRTLSSNRESPSYHNLQGTTTTTAQVEPVFHGGEFRPSIENAAFGFSPNPPDSHGYNADADPYDGNHGALLPRFQNSTYGNELTGRTKRTHDTTNVEVIESFSDEEYVPAWGHQTETNARAGQRQFAKRPKRVADPNKSLTQQHMMVSNGQLVLGRDPPVDRGVENIWKPEPSSNSSKNKQGSMERDLRYHYQAAPEQNEPVTNRGLPSSNHHVMPEVTYRQTVHRPRRIRDPSARPVIVPPKRTTSATPFRLYASSAASAPNHVPTAPISVSARTSTWERNDVFGGSGVGAGSYQIQRQPTTKNHAEADDASVVVVDSTQDDMDAATAKRRRAAKPKSYKKGTKTNRASGSRGGGKRGKWGWKNKGKRTTTTKEKGSGTNRQRRVTNTWAGNTDDPQLRHVGGAEMSF